MSSKKIVFLGIAILIMIVLVGIFFAYELEGPDNLDFEFCSKSNSTNFTYIVNCYSQEALKRMNASICEDMSVWVSRNMYISECYKIYALEVLDSRYCRMSYGFSISGASECAYELAVKTGDEDHCKNFGSEMFNPYLEQDNCYKKFAVFKKDKIICNEISEESRILECVEEVEAVL